MGTYLPYGGDFPAGYQQTFDPTSGYDMAQEGMSAMQGIPGALSANALAANRLSSGNYQSSVGPAAQVQLGQLGLQNTALQQNAMNQRFGPLLQLLAGAFGHMQGGSSGFQGFSSNAGQSASGQ